MTLRGIKPDIAVEYVAADGVSRYANAPVDHEQRPSVGEPVTVVYREQNPSRQSCSAMKATVSSSAASA
ncbi:hypothetical protein HC744_07955 [Arthrobacter sp. S1_S22]|uniref:hypothetical protein n=1 Tax=Pseudarthrobacter polychromogenes TaxID=1676 RepID=UPI0016822B52|nr:hypothetical protein [Arthrobacter sp. S1_S22]